MAVVFAMFGKSFDSPGRLSCIALGMTVLVSIVEGGIPNGGYIGELLFISAYGFPPEGFAARYYYWYPDRSGCYPAKCYRR
jgi:hypothetical protein